MTWNKCVQVDFLCSMCGLICGFSYSTDQFRNPSSLYKIINIVLGNVVEAIINVCDITKNFSSVVIKLSIENENSSAVVCCSISYITLSNKNSCIDLSLRINL